MKTPPERNASAAKFFTGAIVLFAVIAVTLVSQTQATTAQTSLFGGARIPEATGIAKWIFEQQAAFYRSLSATLRAAKTDGSAVWALIGISFAYGVFHAAGPGHGKAVIASYLVANRETLRRGIALSFASALLQAITAILVVVIGAILLGATAKAMSNAVRVIEICSYSLIVILGLRLIWVKGVGFVRAFRSLNYTHARNDAKDNATGNGAEHRNAHLVKTGQCGCGHDHHVPLACHADDHHGRQCDDHHDLDVLPWGHVHGPEPEELGGPHGWRRGFSAIVGVGLRPCSGAILVLVFALAQGLFWTGVASTLMMGLGTAITVAASAALAVGAKTFVKRIADERDGYGVLTMRALEVGAAVFVFLFGVLLLGGYIASERLAGF